MASKGYAIEVYDRMLDEKGDRNITWNQKCIYCKSDKLTIHPINIVFKPIDVKENYDDLPKELQKYFASLPNIVEAVLRCVDGERGTSLSIECEDCHASIGGFFNERPDFTGNNTVTPNIQKLKKYLEKKYNLSATPMRLTNYD